MLIWLRRVPEVGEEKAAPERGQVELTQGACRAASILCLVTPVAAPMTDSHLWVAQRTHSETAAPTAATSGDGCRRPK
jgi:hypothetical protein